MPPVPLPPPRVARPIVPVVVLLCLLVLTSLGAGTSRAAHAPSESELAELAQGSSAPGNATTLGPLSLSVSATTATVCADGLSTCGVTAPESRVTLSVTSPTLPTNRSAPVEVLFLLQVSPWLALFYNGSSCEFGNPCPQDAADVMVPAEAGAIAHSLAASHPALNLSFGFAASEGTYGSHDDNDSPVFWVGVGNFTNASEFGPAVNRSLPTDYGLISDQDDSDNLYQSGAVPAFYGVLTGQVGTSPGVTVGQVDWRNGSGHVVVWIDVNAPQAPPYTEDGCVLANVSQCGGNASDPRDQYPSCALAWNFSGGRDPACLGWMNSTDSNPLHSIAALTTVGAACANSSFGRCLVDTVMPNATPVDPNSSGWGEDGRPVSNATVQNDTAHALASGCEIAQWTGGSWDGPLGAHCGNTTGTIVASQTTADPGLLAALQNVSLGAPAPQGVVAEAAPGAPPVRFALAPGFALAPQANLTVQCTIPPAVGADCPSAGFEGDGPNGTVLVWNWTGADGGWFARGETWNASFNVVATVGPRPPTVLDANGSAGANGTPAGVASGVLFVDVAANVTEFAPFPAVSIAVAAPQALAAKLSAPTEAEVGVPANLTVTMSGGYLPYSVVWSFGNRSRGDAGAVTARPTFESGGTLWAQANITDSLGNVLEVGQKVAVEPALELVTTPAIAGGPAPFDTTFVATPSDGQAPYHVVWQLPNGTAVSGEALPVAFDQPGTEIIGVTATDSLGGTAASSVLVGVSAPAGEVPLALTLRPTTTSGATPACGSAAPTYHFSASAAGGTAPYDYAWTFGDGASASGADVSHQYAYPSDYEVTVSAIDANGSYAIASQQVSTSVLEGPACVPAASHAGPGLTPTLLVVALVGVAAVAAVAVLLARRRGR